jgi:DNA polymerase-3 subunit delta
VFYIFHGDDDLGLGEELAGLRERVAGGDPAMGDLNTTILGAEGLTLGELRHACDTIPFLADRRLVIVHGLLAHLGPRQRARDSTPSTDTTSAAKREFRTQLAAYLPHLPPTTRLIFVEKETLPPSHPILKVAQAEHEQGRAYVRLYERPRERDLPAWIRQRAGEKDGTFNTEAVEMLAALVGTDLRSLDLEIDKLLLHADGRPVTKDDVDTLVSRSREADIFELVDCVGRRQTDRALKLLHEMLDDREAPLYLLAMLTRQIRILIQVTELGEQNLTPKQIARRLNLHPYVVEKSLVQARNFDLAQLERAHERLVQADWSIKTGEAGEVLALDMLVIALTRV